VTLTPVKPLEKIFPATDVSAVQAPEAVPDAVISKAAIQGEAVETSDYEEFGSVMKDEDVAAAMDRSGVDRMLQLCVKPSTLAKYSTLWDKWVSF
jgi:Cu2+-containing amine oxidase